MKRKRKNKHLKHKLRLLSQCKNCQRTENKVWENVASNTFFMIGADRCGYVKGRNVESKMVGLSFFHSLPCCCNVYRQRQQSLNSQGDRVNLHREQKRTEKIQNKYQRDRKKEQKSNNNSKMNWRFVELLFIILFSTVDYDYNYDYRFLLAN